MGRKPNPLILKHFDRGAKLNDSSNRYAHTCKACGEKFPKGRIDTLQTHIIKRCPAQTDADRHAAAQVVFNLSSNEGGHTHNGEMQMVGHSIEGMNPNGLWTPLDALAEVSRQVGQVHALDHTPTNHQNMKRGPPGTETQSGKRLKLQEQYTLDNPPVSYEQRVQRDKKLLEQKTTRQTGESLLSAGNSNSMDAGEHILPHSSSVHNAELALHLTTITSYQPNNSNLQPGNYPPHMTNSRSTSPTLAIAATSMAQAAAAQFVPSMVDPQLDPQLLGDNNDDTNRNLAENALAQQLHEANASMSGSGGFYGAVPEDQHTSWMNDTPADNLYSTTDNHFSNTTEPTQPTAQPGMQNGIQAAAQTRAQPSNYPPLAMHPATAMTTEFSAESGDGQRINKPKHRQRFQEDRRKEVQAVRKMGACTRCRMLKKPCTGGTPCATCLKVEHARIWKSECTRDRLEKILQVFSAGPHTVLSYEKVSKAKTQMAFNPCKYQIEASHYPETTVFATFNALEGKVRSLEGNIDPGLSGDFTTPTRLILDSENDDLSQKIGTYTKFMQPVFFQREPSHFMHTTLNTANQIVLDNLDKGDVFTILADALQLWSVVHILVDHELTWLLTEKVDPDAPAGAGPTISQNDDDGTYHVICMQLSGAVEKKASALAKNVLGALERKLLQKSSNESFELFLVGILILNCLEKSTWLFNFWEQEEFKNNWPLETAPTHFAAQGEQVTNMLDMLLRMRLIPPKTISDEDGILTCDRDAAVQEYFDKIKLVESHVIHQRDHYHFDPSNSRSYELRYCARILLQDPASPK